MPELQSEYLLESDEEVNRLSNQLEVIKDAMGGKLVYAPLDHAVAPLRILDSGRADGTWIADFNEQTHGRHQIIGTDLSDKDFPKVDVPTNTEYYAQDINHDWPAEYKELFDLVHQRLTLVGARSRWEAALSRLADMVKPGGWIQLIESENTMPSQADNPAMHDFLKLMIALFTFMGAPLTLTDDIPNWLANHDFGSIHKKQINLQQGNNNPAVELAKRGLYANIVAAKALVAFAESKLFRHLGGRSQNIALTIWPALPEPPISKERLGTIIPDLKKELAEKGAIFPLRVIWAQKKASRASE